MRKMINTALVVAAAAGLAGGAAGAQGTNPADHIESVIRSYETALNASDANAVMDLWATDGVLMAPNVPALVGTDAVRAGYGQFFEALAFALDFEIDEVVVASDEWAFARSRSTGSATLNATGDVLPQGNQELFVFHRGDDGVWRIARYAFNTTLPAN